MSILKSFHSVNPFILRIVDDIIGYFDNLLLEILMIARWRNRIAVLLVFLCLPITLVFAQEPENIADVKKRLELYHDSGRYQSDVQSVIEVAEDYLRKRIEMNKADKTHHKLAIVLDIDETSLSNYSSIKTIDFSGTLRLLRAYLTPGDDPPIKPTLELFKLAQQHHVSVFFITGRNVTMRAETIRNLKNVGFSGWQGLFFKPSDYQANSAAPFKTSVRKKITEEGYDIVLNIGDQKSDLLGGYAERNLKLPNPYYFVP